MAFETNNTQNNNASDKPKADGYINLRAVCNKTGQEFKLTGIKHYGIALMEENGGISEALLKQARANNGSIEITIKAVVNVVAETPDADSFGEF